jgi:hypothetical protein
VPRPDELPAEPAPPGAPLEPSEPPDPEPLDDERATSPAAAVANWGFVVKKRNGAASGFASAADGRGSAFSDGSAGSQYAPRR